MLLSDLPLKVYSYLKKYNEMKFTGQIFFTFDFRDGGIGNWNVEIKHRDNEFKEENKKNLHTVDK